MAAKAKPKSKAKPQPKSKKKVTTKSKTVSKKLVKAKKIMSKAKAKPKKAKVVAKSKPKSKGATKAFVRSKATPNKAVKGKAKTLTNATKTTKSKTSAKKTKLASKKPNTINKTTIAKTTGLITKQLTGVSGRSKVVKTATTPKATKAEAKTKKSMGQIKKIAVSSKKPVGGKSMKKDASKTGTLDVPVLNISSGKAAPSSSQAGEPTGAVLPDDIAAELDIEIERDGDITLESLTSELNEDSDDLKVADLDDDDFADDDFAEDLADESDEDLDLTEDLAEELDPGKFIREPEGNRVVDEDEPPRSW